MAPSAPRFSRSRGKKARADVGTWRIGGRCAIVRRKGRLIRGWIPRDAHGRNPRKDPRAPTLSRHPLNSLPSPCRQNNAAASGIQSNQGRARLAVFANSLYCGHLRTRIVHKAYKPARQFMDPFLLSQPDRFLGNQLPAHSNRGRSR